MTKCGLGSRLRGAEGPLDVWRLPRCDWDRAISPPVGKSQGGGGSEHGLRLRCCVSKMCWQASQLLAAALRVGRGPGVVSPGLAMAQGAITKYRREKSTVRTASNVTEAMWPEAHGETQREDEGRGLADAYTGHRMPNAVPKPTRPCARGAAHIPLTALSRKQPCWRLNPRPLAFRSVRQYISVI